MSTAATELLVREMSGKPPLHKDPEVRLPLGLLAEEGVTLGIVKTYAAIRARAGFEAAADNFLKSWPGIDTIAADAAVTRATVFRALDWLEARDFLLIQRHQRSSNVYTLVLWRAWFRELVRLHGRREARSQLERHFGDLDQESRSGQAKALRRRRRIPHPKRLRGLKSHARDCLDGTSPGGSHARDQGGVTDATSVVARMRPRTVDQENCVSENSGAAAATRLPVSHTLKNNNRGHPVDERHHHDRLLRRGIAAATARERDQARTFEEKLAEARRKAEMILKDAATDERCTRPTARAGEDPGG